MYVDPTVTVQTPLKAATSIEDLMQWVDIFSTATATNGQNVQSSITQIPVVGSTSSVHTHAYKYARDVPIWLNAYEASTATPGNMSLLSYTADRKIVQTKLKASGSSSAAAFADALCPFDAACVGNLDTPQNAERAAARKVLLQVAVPAVWSDGRWRAGVFRYNILDGVNFVVRLHT